MYVCTSGTRETGNVSLAPDWTTMPSYRPRHRRRSAVFIASTPLQYINAREAAEAFDVNPRAMVVPLINYDRSVFERMDPDEFWPEIIYLSRPHPGMLQRLGWVGRGMRLAVDWFFYRHLTAVAEYLRPVDTLFVGFYDAYYQRHFANRIEPERLVAVDDGAATISIHRRRRRGPAPEPRCARTRLRHSLLGVDYEEFSQITLFTAYDLQPAYDRIVRNRYEHFRNQFQSTIGRNGDVWLLGQPAIRDSSMNLTAYCRCVQDAVDAYPQVGAVRYIPHPREHPDTITTVVENTPVQLKQTAGPIEWELATAGRWPRRLAGFFSSAIQTCRKIFGDQLPTDVLMPDPAVWTSCSDDVDSIYSMYRKTTLPPHRFVKL